MTIGPMMSHGAWIAFGGALAIWSSPDAAMFAGVMIFLFGLAEQAYKARRKRYEMREDERNERVR